MWIDIKEQEPENWQIVLVYPFYKGVNTIELATYLKDTKEFFSCWSEVNGPLDVDYWMPLPKPPIDLVDPTSEELQC